MTHGPNGPSGRFGWIRMLAALTNAAYFGRALGHDETYGARPARGPVARRVWIGLARSFLARPRSGRMRSRRLPPARHPSGWATSRAGTRIGPRIGRGLPD